MGLVPDLGFVTEAFSHRVTLREYGPPTTDANGNRIRGAATDRTILAHCYPTPGEALRNLGAGHESGKSITIRTTELIRVSDPATQYQSPAIRWAGRWYEVTTEGQRTADDGGYSQHEYFAKLVRREDAPGAEAP